MAKKFLTPIDLNLNELLNFLLQKLGADPGGPVEGQAWYNSTSKVLKFRTNTATISLGRLDQISAPTAAVDFNTQKLTSVANGTNPGDAVNYGQLQAAQTGLDVKASVRVASVADVDLGTPGANIDGIAMVNGDRVLLKDQTAPEENGIYVFNGAASAMTRATDADSDAEVTSGLFTFVEEGTAAGEGWVLITANPIVVDTTELEFSRFSAVPSGGTVNKYAEDIGDNSATSIAVTHNLGTTDVVVSVHENSGGAEVECGVTITNGNVVTLDFTVAPDVDELRAVVVG